jgi:glycosyltransferase involved in cell wall biosynthesis
MKKKPILVTIGIPTYNRANSYLRKAIESAIEQTYTNLEIIVADNGSLDATEDLVKEYTDKRIQYIKHRTNIGANNNFNFCVNRARGEYFLLLHDDDLIDPDFVEVSIRALNGAHHPGFIRTGTRVIDSRGQVVSELVNEMQGKSLNEFILQWFDNKTVLYMCSTLFNTMYLREIGGFQSKTHLYQDVSAEMILAAKYGRVDVYDVKASFRRHYDSRGKGNKIDAWNIDSLYLLDIICNILPNNNKEIKNKGLIYFSKQNYLRASRIPSLIERWNAYMRVYKSFHYSYSPFRYWIPRLMKSKSRSLKRRLKLIGAL